jgi:hypothetical protein
MDLFRKGFVDDLACAIEVILQVSDGVIIHCFLDHFWRCQLPNLSTSRKGAFMNTYLDVPKVLFLLVWWGEILPTPVLLRWELEVHEWHLRERFAILDLWGLEVACRTGASPPTHSGSWARIDRSGCHLQNVQHLAWSNYWVDCYLGIAETEHSVNGEHFLINWWRSYSTSCPASAQCLSDRLTL